MSELHDSRLREALTQLGTARGLHDVARVARQLDDYIGAYSRVNSSSHYAPTRCADISGFYARHRSELLAGVVLACANLSRGALPTSIYPWTFALDLTRGVHARGRNNPTQQLLGRVKDESPHDWAAFGAAVSALGQDMSHARAWPQPEQAQVALVHFERLGPIWARAVAELDNEVGAKRKDLAYQRALRWPQRCEWVLRALASPRQGPLRLFMAYMLGLISYFEAQTLSKLNTGESRSACAVLVLEVFSLVDTCAEFVDDAPLHGELTLGSRGQRSDSLRKRIQRGRLHSGRHHATLPHALLDDESWTGALLPELEGLARRLSLEASEYAA